MKEREGIITMKGDPLTLLGPGLEVGDTAPDFEVAANDLSPVSLTKFKGKICVITTVPSLDTPVCDIMTKKFNEETTDLDDDVVILAVSMDLPFAQSRWCGASGVENIHTLSDYNGASFGQSYGVLIKGLHLLARAVFVVDKEGIIRYVEIVNELTNEPDYKAAIEAVKELV
jgi:thiol peroxidase